MRLPILRLWQTFLLGVGYAAPIVIIMAVTALLAATTLSPDAVLWGLSVQAWAMLAGTICTVPVSVFWWWIITGPVDDEDQGDE